MTYMTFVSDNNYIDEEVAKNLFGHEIKEKLEVTQETTLNQKVEQ